MPRPTPLELTGILLEKGPYPILRAPDGGEWRLDILKRHKHLLGTRVKVTGTRDGFDLLAARRLTGCERSDNQDENRLLGCR
ncbi:DUF5818 domain-containing protein [Sphingobium sp. PNB]|uniref:DUF5818 domain-containing protein n=1 Tax=Sphingobium sp. PNB TaxID=863934 RepID=UPI001CA43026|nr:DUF5818 domain-containing protein [Sphingobium sp. PNB]MCB4863299.1 DUF5818 domain-containing protein [Sphingobium sp. PNB]